MQDTLDSPTAQDRKLTDDEVFEQYRIDFILNDTIRCSITTGTVKCERPATWRGVMSCNPAHGAMTCDSCRALVISRIDLGMPVNCIPCNVTDLSIEWRVL